MRRLIAALTGVSLCLIVVGGARPAFGQHAGWHDSLAEAEAAAERDGVPLLIHFHAWYCGPCRQMESRVFPSADVQAALQRGLHAVQVDVTRDPDVATRYQATTVPRDVVVYPDGRVETRQVGFVSRSAYLAMLRDVAASGSARGDGVPLPADAARAVVQQGGEAADDRAVVHNAEPKADRETVLGLDGYCPVQLTTERKWIAGDRDIAADYRGVTYYFASLEDRSTFLKNPKQYAPENLGCDPVVLYEDQRAVSGQIRYGAFFDGHLYLFQNGDNRTAFKKNPLQYTRIRHAVRIDQVEGRRVL